MNNAPSDQIAKAVTSALNQMVESIVNEEAEAAAKRVKVRVCACAGEIATRIVQNVDFMHPFDNTLDVIVRIKTK